MEDPVETLRLRKIQQAGHVGRLLQGLAKNSGMLADGARPLRDRGELPAGLQQVIMQAARDGVSWTCWLDGQGHIWLFTAEMSLPLSRKRGAPVLQVNHYREDGELKEMANWVNRDARWQRCDQ
jgi:hypothetical protein